MTLTIRPSTSLALVGASGSGKSTIAALLLGLHPPSSPPLSLTYASHPWSTLSTCSLRSQIAYVPQSPVLLPATIANNIAYGLPPTYLTPPTSPHPHPLIEHAARLAGLHDFIASLPLAYNTPVSATSSLSGGQTQRIAIARALARRPKVLVLDEATASLDQEAARGVREMVRGIVDRGDGMAVVWVTHDVEVMRGVDEVAVVEMGRVVEVGAWEDLIGREGGGLRRLLGREM